MQMGLNSELVDRNVRVSGFYHRAHRNVRADCISRCSDDKIDACGEKHLMPRCTLTGIAPRFLTNCDAMGRTPQVYTLNIDRGI